MSSDPIKSAHSIFAEHQKRDCPEGWQGRRKGQKVKLQHRAASKTDGPVMAPIENSFTTYAELRWPNFYDQGYRGVIFSENAEDIGLAWWQPRNGGIFLGYLIFLTDKRGVKRGDEAYGILREHYWGKEIPVEAYPGEGNPKGMKFFKRMQQTDDKLKVG